MTSIDSETRVLLKGKYLTIIFPPQIMNDCQKILSNRIGQIVNKHGKRLRIHLELSKIMYTQSTLK